MYASVPFVQHLGLQLSFGCELTEAAHIKVDSFQKTNIPGVFTCGDSTTMMRSAASAVSTVNTAGAMVDMELTQEEF